MCNHDNSDVESLRKHYINLSFMIDLELCLSSPTPWPVGKILHEEVPHGTTAQDYFTNKCNSFLHMTH